MNMYYLTSQGYHWVSSTRLHDTYFSDKLQKYATRHKDTGEVTYPVKWIMELDLKNG